MSLLDARADVNATANNGITALHLACDNTWEKEAARLIAAGADLFARAANGKQPLEMYCGQVPHSVGCRRQAVSA